MSDILEEETYYRSNKNVFDNDAKFENESKKEAYGSDVPEKSVEYYSTTYASNKNLKNSRLQEEDDEEEKGYHSFKHPIHAFLIIIL